MFAIEMLNVSKKFGDFYANKDITLQVKKGEIHALLGENGAGKSTLMNLLFGFYTLDEGCIKIDGKEINISNPNIANELGIGMVHQHFKLVDNFTVAQNVTLGHEYSNKGIIDFKKMNKEVQETIDKYNFNLNATDIVSDLSVGQQQKIEILKMLHQNAKYLIFDEPSAALTPQEIKELLKSIKSLKESGKTIIIITHKLDEIREVADSCTVIRKGRGIKCVDVASTTNEELVELMIGREIDFNVKKSEYNPGAKKLEVNNLLVKNGDKVLVNNATFDLYEGEILGLAAIEGNGQHELIQGIMGNIKVESGTIAINGNNITNKSIRNINESGISYIPQDRQKYGVVLDFDIANNAVLKDYYNSEYSSFGILKAQKIRSKGEYLIDKYDIRCNSGVDSILRDMSGGNQQKLIIGRELELNPDVLVAVQPTRGVDVGAIENIHKQLIEQRDLGKSILLVSLELDEVIQLSDRIMVMHDGEILDILDAKEATEEKIGLLMAGIRG